TRDVTIGDAVIKEDEQVWMWYVSGNRDDEVFENPDVFDIRRANARRHQSFGFGGPHYCLGAALARLEARVLLEEIVTRMGDLEPNGETRRMVTTGFFNSFTVYPVKFTPGPQVNADAPPHSVFAGE